MSSEESYLAIQRYLTDEREPYAPGTQGNAKRKIRKAAACYVVRDGTLYYQRRQKGLDEFTELEVVLQAGRRKELIDEAHIVPGGEHLNQQQTWESISQKYWWRGILKQVKDYIRECSQCRGRQERGRGWVEEAAGETAGGRRERRRGTAAPDSEDEEDEEDDEIPELLPVTSGQQKSARSRKSMAKHELVFVDSKGVVKQPLPKHGQTLLEKLNQQRLNGQFCDVTLLIEGEEHRAHKAVLAACSDYFSELFIEKGAVSSHEAVVDLSGFSKASFLPLLEFAYTSCLTFNFCIMAEVATVARHLLMTEVLQLCESVHKQVEEQRLMVYQRGDVHTVLSSQSLPPSQQASVEEGDVYMVTVQDNGQTMVCEGRDTVGRKTLAVVTQDGQAVTGETLAVVTQDGQAVTGETLAVVTQDGQAVTGETLAVVTQDGQAVTGETLAVVTQDGQAVTGETLAVVTQDGQAVTGETLAVVTQDGQAVTGETLALVTQDGQAVTGETLALVTQDGQAVTGETLALVTQDGQAVTGETLALVTQDGQAVTGETLAVVTQDGQAVTGETLAVVTQDGQAVTGETLAVVTQDGQTVTRETLAVVSALWPVQAVQAADASAGSNAEKSSEALVIGVDPQKSVSAKASDPALTRASDPPLSAEPPPQPQPVRRRPGRPAKVRPVLLHSGDPSAPVTKAPAGSATPEPADGGAGAVDDTYKGRLRRRSLGEGGYVRLHMGLERPEEQKSEVQKVAPKVVRRGRPGRPPKVPRLEEEEEPKTPTGPAEAGMLEAAAPPEMAHAVGPEEGAAAPEHVGGASGEHKCAECGLVFQRRYALIMHTLKHEKTRGYKCSLCSKDFQYAASLRAHIARHKRQKSQRASVAPRAPSEAADSSGDSEEGRSRIRTRREFVCDICGKTLPKLYSLRIHMLHHTGVRPHSCKVCGKSFAHKHSLKMHRALHDSMRQFQCTLCDKSFVSKRSLEEHTSIHTGESKYLCTTCGKPFHRASGLSKHLKRHQPRPEVRAFPCSHCDKSFYEAKDLQQHMNKHLGLKPFQCQVCGKCYSWKKDWYSHVKSHSVAEPFRCNICGKEFFEKALFRRHVKKATHGKKGRVKQNLERECEHCGRKFTQLREYRRHMNNHQGVKPFECLTCGVAWADARSLKRHVRTHTGERPYVCPVCQDAHIDARTLRKHMVKYHGDYLPGKIMLEKDTLQFHNQGTQVEHAISILAPELPPELQAAHASAGEEIETALVTEETVEAVQAVSEMPVDGGAVSTLSDQSIMQVVNYVLAQRATQPGGGKLEEHAGDVIHTVEVEVAHVAEVE
uniref:Zinc finger and BTB domain containing 11 n=1 Tax=Paramormyrops kingsleyae TaxID=1676925 RepID=A0A3B3SEA5_9TELE|nr:zinc finger and BTB domain-containing protein 11 [Paramormyrops kingsleyae]